MCRAQTHWSPGVAETKRVDVMIGQTWKLLTTPEQASIKLAWIVAGIVSVTDPIGFAIVSSLALLIVPPFLWPWAIRLLRPARDFLVGDNKPGLRIALGVGVAAIISMLAVANHHANDLVTLEQKV